jgi:hypothetical protein
VCVCVCLSVCVCLCVRDGICIYIYIYIYMYISRRIARNHERTCEHLIVTLPLSLAYNTLFLVEDFRGFQGIAKHRRTFGSSLILLISRDSLVKFVSPRIPSGSCLSLLPESWRLMRAVSFSISGHMSSSKFSERFNSVFAHVLCMCAVVSMLMCYISVCCD